jgi:hypothetical protein
MKLFRLVLLYVAIDVPAKENRWLLLAEIANRGFSIQLTAVGHDVAGFSIFASSVRR